MKGPLNYLFCHSVESINGEEETASNVRPQTPQKNLVSIKEKELAAAATMAITTTTLSSSTTTTTKMASFQVSCYVTLNEIKFVMHINIIALQLQTCHES